MCVRWLGGGGGECGVVLCCVLCMRFGVVVIVGGLGSCIWLGVLGSRSCGLVQLVQKVSE